MRYHLEKKTSLCGWSRVINQCPAVGARLEKTSFNLLAWHPRVRCHRSKKPACRPVSCHQSLLCCVGARLRHALSSCSSAYISRVERLGNSRSVKTDLDCFVRSGHVAARGATEKNTSPEVRSMPPPGARGDGKKITVHLRRCAIDATSGRARDKMPIRKCGG